MSAGIRPVPVVCDTNVLVSALLGSAVNGRILEIFKAGEIDLLFSKESLAELVEVLSRPQFKIPPSEIRALFRLVRKRAQVIRKVNPLDICRDPKDNMVIATALSGKARYLVTGDKDILSLAPMPPLQLLSPSEFIRRFEGHSR